MTTQAAAGAALPPDEAISMGRITSWLIEPRISREDCLKWITALESGCWQQASGKLWDTGKQYIKQKWDYVAEPHPPVIGCKMCCLGVELWVTGQLTPETYKQWAQDSSYLLAKVVKSTNNTSHNEADCQLGRVSAEGITPNGITPNGEQLCFPANIEPMLARSNDVGVSFAQIAKWLRRELLPRCTGGGER